MAADCSWRVWFGRALPIGRSSDWSWLGTSISTVCIPTAVTDVTSRWVPNSGWRYGVPSIDLSRCNIQSDVARLISPRTAWKYHVIPLSRVGTTLRVAMTDPTNVLALDDIKFMTGFNLESVVAPERAVLAALHRFYGHEATADATTGSLEVMARELADLPPVGDADVEVLEDVEELDVVALERQGGEAPVVRLVNTLLAAAVRRGASDIHIEPYEKEVRVRFRIDGVLYNIMAPPLRVRDAMTSRLKILAKLDIAEKRLPQDGRVKLRLRDAGKMSSAACQNCQWESVAGC